MRHMESPPQVVINLPEGITMEGQRRIIDFQKIDPLGVSFHSMIMVEYKVRFKFQEQVIAHPLSPRISQIVCLNS